MNKKPILTLLMTALVTAGCMAAGLGLTLATAVLLRRHAAG